MAQQSGAIKLDDFGGALPRVLRMLCACSLLLYSFGKTLGWGSAGGFAKFAGVAVALGPCRRRFLRADSTPGVSLAAG